MDLDISKSGQGPSRAAVYLIDGDACARNRGQTLIRSVGLHVETFAGAEDFLAWQRPTAPSCVVVEVRLAGISGLVLQRRLAEANDRIPIIFVTAHGDVQMAVSAIKAGAIDFLTKPCRDQDLLDAIHLSIEHDRVSRAQEFEMAMLWRKFTLLSAREREVLKLVVHGQSNKGIAAQIGLSENTVKVHRSRATGKLKAESLADLVKMTQRLEAFKATSTSLDSNHWQANV